MKSKLLIWVLLAIVAPCMLFAANYNVLVYPYNEQVIQILTAHFPTRFSDNSILEAKASREMTAQQRVLGEALHNAYLTKSDKAILKSSTQLFDQKVELESDRTPSDVVVLNSGSYSFDVNAILSEDLNYLNYMCEISDADLILVPVVSRISNFHHLEIYSFSYKGESLSKLYENVSPDSETFGNDVVIPFSSLFNEEPCGLLYLDGYVTGCDVLIDGFPTNVHDGFAVVSEGSHELSISCVGYQKKDLSVKIDKGLTTNVDASLVKISYSDLAIYSHPDSEILIDGKLMGQTPLRLDSYSIPFSLSFRADGYQMETLNIESTPEKISVELKPSWLGSTELLKSAKDEFYSDFARSLILFGAKIALGAFHDGRNEFFSSLDIVANGALTISLIDLVGSLVDYYRHSVYVTP